MTTIDNLRQSSDALQTALDDWESSNYSDDEALQTAVSEHARLAPVFAKLYGHAPLISPSYPPYITMRRARDELMQAIGALDGGLFTQDDLDR
jgi:hypothetical protein